MNSVKDIHMCRITSTSQTKIQLILVERALVQCHAINFESGNGNFPSLALLDILKLFNFMLHFIFHIHFVDHDENASVLHFSTLKADICQGIHNQILIL